MVTRAEMPPQRRCRMTPSTLEKYRKYWEHVEFTENAKVEQENVSPLQGR